MVSTPHWGYLQTIHFPTVFGLPNGENFVLNQFQNERYGGQN